MVVGELRLHIFERAIDRQFAIKRVDHDRVANRFEVYDVRQFKTHLAVAGLDQHRIVAIAAQGIDGTLEFLRKRKPRYGFEQI